MAVILAVLIGFVVFHYLSTVDRSQSETSTADDLTKTADQPSGPVESQTQKSSGSPLRGGSQTTIRDNAELETAVVTYDGSKFSPEKVSITSEPGNQSCLLTVVNKSFVPLSIRLSPHDPKDERGFPYPAVLPGEQSIIDPRYRIPEISFHNHEKPNESFSISLAEGCL